MTESIDERAPSLRHPVLIAVVSLVALVVSAAVAFRRPVYASELRLTQWFNEAPEWVAHLLWPVMQAGTVTAVLAAAAVVGWRARNPWLAIVAAVAGFITWFGAKWVKAMVERGRPLAYLPGIDVRDGRGTGFGYLSGHSATAACTAAFVAAVLPPRWRAVAASVAALVGVARIVHGVHLPADVVGGWAFGTLVGLAGLGVARCTDRSVFLATSATSSRRRSREVGRQGGSLASRPVDSYPYVEEDQEAQGAPAPQQGQPR